MSSPSGDVAGADEAVAVASALLPAEADIERIECSSPGYARDMVARLRGSGSARVLLVGHLDTVVGHGEHRPMEHEEDRLVGSGTVDMKGGVVLSLGVLRALARDPSRFAEVVLLLVVDEEWRTAPFAHGERFAGFDASLCFEAGERGPGGEEGVIVKRKAAGTLRVRAHGVAAHSGSAPDKGRNALLALAEVARSVAARHDPNGPDRLTAVPTVIRSGEAFNAVPAAGELHCDMRADRLGAFDPVLEAVPEEPRRRAPGGGSGASLARDGHPRARGAAAGARDRAAGAARRGNPARRRLGRQPHGRPRRAEHRRPGPSGRGRPRSARVHPGRLPAHTRRGRIGGYSRRPRWVGNSPERPRRAMPEIDGFKDGLPSWADLASPDPDESVSFYGELLGLEATDADEEMGGYRMFMQGDKQVAGLMQVQDENQPPSWTTYINVSDADAAAEKVKEAGGQVHLEPMDVREFGRMAVFADPTGAVFGVWQPGEHKGAGIVSEPGSVAWHQCNTRDTDKALEFYAEVFGWESEKVDTGGADYWQLTKDGASVGGLFRIGDDFPDDVPAHWIVYFAVEDADAATENAREKGAGVRAEPFDNEAGRFAVLQDPHGAAFALINQGGGSVAGQEQGQGDEQSGDDEAGDDEAGDDESRRRGQVLRRLTTPPGRAPAALR